MRFLQAVLIILAQGANANAQDLTGNDWSLYGSFEPISEEAAEHMFTFEWKVVGCRTNENGGLVILFDIVGNSDPEMEDFALTETEVQPIFVADKRWLSPEGHTPESICALLPTS